MLQLFVGEANQRLECVLVAQPVVAAHLEDLGAYEALDQTEDVGIRASLDLRQQATLVGAEKRQPVNERQSVGQEFLGEVEFAAANHVAIDVPVDALGYLDALGVTRGIDVGLQDGLRNKHGCSPWGRGGWNGGIAETVGGMRMTCPGVGLVGGEGVANVYRVHFGRPGEVCRARTRVDSAAPVSSAATDVISLRSKPRSRSVRPSSWWSKSETVLACRRCRWRASARRAIAPTAWIAAPTISPTSFERWTRAA